MKTVGLILAKRHSKRLPNKNILSFNFEPMFLTNVRKCLKIFDKVYVSSDDEGMLEDASEVGAICILRPKELAGDTPNIPVYQHAMKEMNCDAFVAVQANSPNIEPGIIESCARLVEDGVYSEVITIHPDEKIYGSVWAMTRERLENYGDPYKPTAQYFIKDDSIDIHDIHDYENAIAHNKKLQ